jgi:lipid II:glycine glycyltransferase (peptidoglycan interpeptide bridge formation enzyme)
MITYRRASVTVAETFFDEEVAASSADIVRHRLAARPVPGSYQCAQSYTLWLNLKTELSSLLSKMSRATRSQIRRGQREGLCYDFNSTPSGSRTEQFFEFFDCFAKSRNLPSVNRSRLLALRNENALDLSCMSCPDGRVLVWHAHLRTSNHACCLYSASLFRSKARHVAAYIGRANRLHHWSDMLRFRNEGLAIYDFGGWYAGDENKGLLRINRFKESFGGELVLRYDCDQAVTWKGALALALRAATRKRKCFQSCTSRHATAMLALRQE